MKPELGAPARGPLTSRATIRNVDENDRLAERFEGHRTHLKSAAYRISRPATVNGKVVAIDILADRERLAALDITL